jgi:hypothetical protein
MADAIRTLVLVGVTGDGKSTTGNTLSATDAFKVSSGLASATQACAHADYLLTSPAPTLFRVVDTIGLQDTGLPAADVLARFAAFSDHTPFGIDIFLLVIRFGRFKPEHEAAIAAFVANCGAAALAHTVLTFTHCAHTREDLEALLASSAPPALRAILPCLGGIVGVENCAAAAAGRAAIHAAAASVIERNAGARYSNEALSEARKRHDVKEEAERAAFAVAVSDWRKAGDGPVEIVREF